MSRREELERIILGTLLDEYDGDGYMDSCRCCITEDMFSDDVNRRIYKAITSLVSTAFCRQSITALADSDPSVIELVPYMAELATEWSFKYKKLRHNENQWLSWYQYGVKPRYTNVTFDDYVTRFVSEVFANSRKS